MNKEIFRLAIPNILSNISVPLLGSVDTALMGQFSALHLGAVGLGGLLFSFLYWNFGFLRMGTTGMTAQAFGAGNFSESTSIWMRAMLIALGAGLLMLLSMSFLGDVGFRLLGAQEESLGLLGEYFYARIWAAPATLSLLVIMGWFFGMQNALYPLILTIIANGLNIIFNIILVNHLDWGIAGVAWGTVWAQYLSLFAALFLLWYKYREKFNLLQTKTLFVWEKWKGFVSVNRDILIRTIFLTTAFAFFYRQSSLAGPMVLAVNVILLQFLNWMSYGIDGFAYAAESLIGKYKGAQDENRLRLAIKKSFIFGMSLAAAYALIYLVFGNSLAAIFSDDASIIDALQPFLFWMVLLPLLSTPSYLWDGIYIGLTASRAMRNSMTLAFILFITAWYFLQPFGNHGLWASLLILMFARGAFQQVLFLIYGTNLK